MDEFNISTGGVVTTIQIDEEKNEKMDLTVKEPIFTLPTPSKTERELINEHLREEAKKNSVTVKDLFGSSVTGDDSELFATIRRENYASEDAYIDALAQEKVRRSSPEYQKARQSIERQIEQQKIERQKEAYKTQIEKEVKTADIYEYQKDQIAEEALYQARRECGAGKISARDIGKRAQELTDERIAKAKNSRAVGNVFNKILRGEI